MCSTSVPCILFLAVLTVFAAYIGSRLDVEPVHYVETPPPQFEGALAANKHLENAEKILVDVDGPEAIAFYKGELYTSLSNGTIVKISANNKVSIVGYTGKPETCDKFYNEAICGRPLGLRFGHKDDLYVADAFYGLLRINVSKGSLETLFSSKDLVNGKYAKFSDDLDITKEGDIYFSDASSKWWINEAQLDFMESAPNGRILHYDPRTKQTKELISNLHFPNGVQLSPDQSYFLFAETTRSRINKYYLKGPKKGTHEIFVDNLPGSPDNIRSNGKGGYWVGLCVVRLPNKTSLVSLLSPHPLVRKTIMRIGYVVYWLAKQVDSIVPNHYTRYLVHYMPHLGNAKFIMPNYGMAVELNEKGEIIRSIHSPSGKVKFVSHIQEHEGYLYIGSPWNNYLAKVKS